MADRIAARCDHAQMASKTCQESARPPVQGGRPSSCLRRGVGRYSIKFTDHGWHHEPHSPVKTSCVESGTHPEIRLRSPRRPLRSLVFVCMHALRTMRTPSSIRTRTAPDAARSRPMLVRFGGGVWTPSTIRRRATPHTGFPLVVMFMVARWTKGATRAKRPRSAIHARTHRSALSSCLVHRSHPGCPRSYVCK